MSRIRVSLAVGTYDRVGSASSQQIRTMSGHTDAVWDVAVHPNREALLFSASSDGTVKIWNHKRLSNPCLQTIMHPSGDSQYIPTSLTVLATDSTQLLVAYNDSSISVVDIETSEILHTMKTPSSSGVDLNSQINQIVAHPAQPMAFTAHEDRSIQFFDIRSCEQVHSMVGHLDGVSSLAIDRTGDHLVSGGKPGPGPYGLETYSPVLGQDCSLRIWNIGSRTCVQELMVRRDFQLCCLGAILTSD